MDNKKNISEDEDNSFEGEDTLSIEEREKQDEQEFPENGNDVYPDAIVNIDKEPASVFQLKRKFDKKPSLLKLDPDFQRNSVWNDRQKSELIESIVMGIPLPLIYLKEDKDGVSIIVDGRQRLTTLFDFMNDELILEKLKLLKQLNGKKFSELAPLQQAKIEDCPLTLHTIKPPTKDRVTFDLFDRVNRGGTRLNNQEMRNALYQGNSTKLLAKLSQLKSFKNATSSSINPVRMKDRYLILRFLTFYLWRKEILTDEKGERVEYRSDMEDFLSKSMIFMNNSDNDSTMQKLSVLFNDTMKICFSLYGDNCFRLPKIKESKTRRPVNMALFETISYFVAELKDYAENNRDLMRSKYTELVQNEQYVETLTYTVDSNKSIEKRFKIIETHINEVKNA